MKIQQIRKIAKGMGIKYSGLKKADLIKRIQRAEGNFDCFGSAVTGFCDQTECLWKVDCMVASKVKKMTQ